MRHSSVVSLLLLVATQEALAESPRALTVAERIQLLQAMKDCWTQKTADESLKSNQGGGELEVKVDGAFKKLLSAAADARVSANFRKMTRQEFEDIKAPQNVARMLDYCYQAAFGEPRAPAVGPRALTAPTRQSAPTPAGSTTTPPPQAHVKAASIGQMDVSPEVCTARSPCGGLRRGSPLHLELTRAGYAAAYIQDKSNYYNQEGRLAINGALQGDVSLNPGVDERVDGSVYALYVVVGDARFPATRDSEGLEELPRGERFGPIYLRVDGK